MSRINEMRPFYIRLALYVNIYFALNAIPVPLQNQETLLKSSHDTHTKCLGKKPQKRMSRLSLPQSFVCSSCPKSLSKTIKLNPYLKKKVSFSSKICRRTCSKWYIASVLESCVLVSISKPLIPIDFVYKTRHFSYLLRSYYDS